MSSGNLDVAGPISGFPQFSKALCVAPGAMPSLESNAFFYCGWSSGIQVLNPRTCKTLFSQRLKGKLAFKVRPPTHPPWPSIRARPLVKLVSTEAWYLIDRWPGALVRGYFLDSCRLSRTILTSGPSTVLVLLFWMRVCPHSVQCEEFHIFSLKRTIYTCLFPVRKKLVTDVCQGLLERDGVWRSKSQSKLDDAIF